MSRLRAGAIAGLLALASVLTAASGSGAADKVGPWEAGKRYRYEYRAAGKPIGTETFWFERAGEGWSLRDEADITTDAVGLKAVTAIDLDSSGAPLTAKRRQQVRSPIPGQSGLFETAITMEPGKVRIRILRDESPFWDGDVRVEGRPQVFDNNFLGALAYALAKTGAQGDAKLALFHIGAARVMSLTLGPAQSSIRKVAGRAITVRARTFSLDGVETGTMGFDERGRLVRYTQGDALEVVLTKP
ncbi:MAG: hypothetical protein KC466_21490 [Myxococcales bacterium]|nr:hypothetical protein [Myxococcales bacterium]